ncbi:MAG: histidinol dehydrogenase [Candidatus Zipacnadales bacterium]
MAVLNVEKIADLTPQRRQDIMERSMEDITAIFADVRDTVIDIRDRGDVVSLEHYQKLKHDITAVDIRVTGDEFAEAYALVDPEVVEYLKLAAENIRKFHAAQLEREMWSIEVMPGVLAGQMVRALDRVGCYVPGREATYPSSVLMTILPARVAGVKEVYACTPPGDGMKANPATLVAADIAGCDAVFKLGGPWAVGSMAYGTEVVPKVDKIVGPGNKYVTAAKMAVFGIVDIDSPAGPSEILILADSSANPDWLAIDFLSQIEHDKDAAAVLVTPDTTLAEAVVDTITRELATLPRTDYILPALENNSAVLVARDMSEAIEFANEYAAEHLEIVTEEPLSLLPRIRHAGSIFVGPYAPVPVGDYASGTNHVLPTGQCARMFNGLATTDFIKRPTFQLVSKKGLQALGPAVISLATTEGLPLHAETVRRRLES